MSTKQEGVGDRKFIPIRGAVEVEGKEQDEPERVMLR